MTPEQIEERRAESKRLHDALRGFINSHLPIEAGWTGLASDAVDLSDNIVRTALDHAG